MVTVICHQRNQYHNKYKCTVYIFLSDLSKEALRISELIYSTSMNYFTLGSLHSLASFYLLLLSLKFKHIPGIPLAPTSPVAPVIPRSPFIPVDPGTPV